MGNLQVDKDVDISLGQQRLGKKVIKIKDANLRIDNKQILKDFNVLIQGSERIGISGENGAGKTTLLNVIAEKIPLDSGIVDIGETVKLGYYTQQTEDIPEDKRVINYLSEVGQHVTDKDGNQVSVTELLEQFLFPKFMHGTLIRKLSGGEKRRLYLLKLLMQQPNVLLLDEPTNDLDISTLTVLEDYIDHFSGTVITVSHDRYFLDKVANRLLIFEGNAKIEEHVGKFTDLLNAQRNAKYAKSNSKKQESKNDNKSNEDVNDKETSKKKLTYAEQLEWEHIEDDIDKLDQENTKLQSMMVENGGDYDKLADLQAKLDANKAQSDAKMKRWEYLSQYLSD